MAVTYKGLLESNSSWSNRIYRYKKATDVYTSVSTYDSAFDYFDDDAGVGDILYIGSRDNVRKPFDGILFYIGTAMAGSGITIIPEYYDYDTGAWETIVDYVDETDQFTNAGEHKFYFDNTKQPWITSKSVNGDFLFWIRFRISALTSITEGGAQSTQLIKYQPDCITIADYTSDSPATFDDIYNADKANSFELLEPITPTTGLVIPYSLRPADKLALNISVILSSDTDAGASDTVVIHGNDIDGNSLDETVDVSAGAGTYTTVNKFSSISSIDCNGFSAGTISVSQPQWGIIWHTGNYYKIDKKIYFSNTYFDDNNKQIEINAANFTIGNGSNLMYGNYSFMTLGSLVNEATKGTAKGIQLLINPVHWGYYKLFNWNNAGDINLYSCYISSKIALDGLIDIYDHTNGTRIWNCMFDQHIIFDAMDHTDVFNLNVLNSSAIVRRANTTTTVNRIAGNQIAYAAWFQAALEGYVKDIYARGCQYVVFMSGIAGHYCTIVDTDTDSWQVRWDTNNTGSRLYRNNTINLTVIDKDGNSIPDATVVLKDVDGTEVFNVQTDANGVIAEQEISRGYIEYSGVSGTSLDTDLTKDYSPHTLIVSKPGYQTYKEKFILTKKINWMISLKRVRVNVDNEVIC